MPLALGTLEGQATASSAHFISAVEMARMIRTKKMSAREALDLHLKQIGRTNPKVNAIVTLVPEMAAADAAKADERFHGPKLAPSGPSCRRPSGWIGLITTDGFAESRSLG